MKKILLRTLILSSALFSASILFAQSAPFAGSADITLVPNPAAIAPGDLFTVDVHVDLTGVTGTCAANTVPAVLGGYTIPVAFDPAQATYVSTAACTSPQYAAAPTATDPATASANGVVSIAAQQPSESAPTGDVCVARLTFQSRSASGVSLTPQNTASLSSAFQNCAGGGTANPAAIPFTTATLTIAQTLAVPTLSEYSLFALGLALAAFAALKLR